MKPDFYLGILNITQVPNMKGKIESDYSWLCNPFNDNTVYITKFTIDDDYFSWKFFLKEKDKEQARQMAFTFLDSLKETYPGLTGEVKVKAIDYTQLNKEAVFEEIVLPQPQFSKKICLLRKIVNLFSFKNGFPVKIYILWQRDDSVEIELESELFKERKRAVKLENIYKIKIYLSVELKSRSQLDNEEELSELQGHLEYLTTNIENVDGKGAILREVSGDTLKNILKGEVFWRNLLNEDTGQFYERKIGKIPKEKMPGFINPEIVDFSIPEDFPLNKAIEVRNENITFSKTFNNIDKDIFIGYLIINGVKTKKKKHLPVNYFVHNMLISGMLGTGKTSFNAHIWNEFRIKRPDIGGININYLKKNQGIFYEADIYLNYDSNDFRIPYYFEGEYTSQTLLETAYYLTASQGLGHEVALNMYNLMKDIIKNEGTLPRTLKELFKRLLKWLDDRPYSMNYKSDIMIMIKTRILETVSEPNIKRILQLPAEIPAWFEAWRRGKKIYLDLSTCNVHEKRLLTFAMFQMMQTLSSKVEVHKLQNFIQIDEVFDIFSSNLNQKNYDFIALGHLENVFKKILKSSRSKGIAFILSDPIPSEIFKCIISLTSIKILFRIGYPCFTLFTNNVDEQDFLVSQENRRALVINGINREKYAIWTPDFYFSKSFKNLIRNSLKRICPNCKNTIDNNAKYCSICGNIFKKHKEKAT